MFKDECTKHGGLFHGGTNVHCQKGTLVLIFKKLKSKQFSLHYQKSVNLINHPQYPNTLDAVVNAKKKDGNSRQNKPFILKTGKVPNEETHRL